MESEEMNAQEDGELRQSTTASNAAEEFSYFQFQAQWGATGDLRLLRIWFRCAKSHQGNGF